MLFAVPLDETALAEIPPSSAPMMPVVSRLAAPAVVVLPLTWALTTLAFRMVATDTVATLDGLGLPVVASGVGVTATSPVAAMPMPSGLCTEGAASAAGVAARTRLPAIAARISPLVIFPCISSLS